MNAPDVNDLAREGRLPSDPFRGAKPINGHPVVEASLHAELVAALSTPLPEDYLLNEPPPRPWLLTRNARGVVPLGEVGLLLGAGSLGKTMFVCGLAIAVALGIPWLGFEVETPGPVALLLAEEKPVEVWRRLFAVAKVLGLTTPQRRVLQDRIVPRGLVGHDVVLVARDGHANVRVTPFAETLKSWLSEQRRAFSLIVLDPLVRWAGNDVERDSHAATCYMERLEQMSVLPGSPAVLCTHHTNKVSRRSGGWGVDSSRGSTAITDAARWAFHLEPTGTGKSTVKLRHAKSNYAPYVEDIQLIRDESHLGAFRLATGMEIHPTDRQKVTDADIDQAIVGVFRDQKRLSSMRKVLDNLADLRVKTDRKRARIKVLTEVVSGGLALKEECQ